MKRRYKANVFRDIYDQPYLDVGLTRMKLYKSSKNSLGMVQRLNLLKRLPVHNGCVNSISWNERGDYILSGSDDQHIIITHGFHYKVMAKFKTSHRANIFSAKFLPGRGDCHIVSCSGDGIILYTDLNRPESSSMNQFSCHSGTTYDVVTVPNDPHSFLSCGEDGTVRWFDLRIKEKCRKTSCKEDILIMCERAVTSLSVNPTAPYQLAVGCSDSRVRLFDRRMLGTVAAGYSESTRTRRPLSTFTVPALKERSCRITSLNYSPDGEEILVSFSSDLLYLFTVKDQTNSRNATVEDCNIDGPSTERSPAPVRRLRLRGDWSDTGPNARPERDGGSREPGEFAQTRRTLHSSLMQRMTDVLSRMLNDPATRANLNGGRQPAQSHEASAATGDGAVPASSSTSQESPQESAQPQSNPSRESPRSPVFPFEHPLNESFSVNPFLPLDSPLSPDPSTDDPASPAMDMAQPEPRSLIPESPMSPDPVPEPRSLIPESPMSPDPVPEPRNLIPESPMSPDPTPEGVVTVSPQPTHVFVERQSPMLEDPTPGDINTTAQTSHQSTLGSEVHDLATLLDPKLNVCSGITPHVSQSDHESDWNGLPAATPLDNIGSVASSDGEPSEVLSIHDTGPSKILCVCNAPSHVTNNSLPEAASADELHSVPLTPAMRSPNANRDGVNAPLPPQNHSLPSVNTNQPLDNRLENSFATLNSTLGPESSSGSRINDNSVITMPCITNTSDSSSSHVNLPNNSSHASTVTETSEGNMTLELVTTLEDSRVCPVEPSTAGAQSASNLEDVKDSTSGRGASDEKGPATTPSEGVDVPDSPASPSPCNSQTMATDVNSNLEAAAESKPSEEDETPRFTIGDPEAKMQLIDPLLDENFRRDSPLSPPLVTTESIAIQVTDREEVMSEDETDGASENSGQEMEIESDSSVDGDTQQFPRVMYPRPRQVMIPPGDMTQLRNNEDLIDTLHSMRHRHATEPAVLLSVSGVTEMGAAFAVRLATETNRGPPDIPFLPQNHINPDVLQPQAREGPSTNRTSTDQNDETSREEMNDSTPNYRVIHPIEKDMDDAIEGARMSKARSEEQGSFQPSVKQVFSGHRNARTMIKEACFWGTDYVMSGSDCGHVFVWDRSTGQLVQLFEADDHVVNCLQPHPTLPVLATSGIDYDVKLWAPLSMDSTFDVALADMLKKRNEIMLEETKDTITVPATFMIRMLACLNQIRRGGRRTRRPDDESNE